MKNKEYANREQLDEDRELESLLGPEAPDCPRCGGEMMLRENKSTNEDFWGCKSYPECKGTRKL